MRRFRGAERPKAGRELALALVALACLVACPASFRRPAKDAGSALWVDGGRDAGAAPSEEQLAALAGAGIEELFLAAARIGDDGAVEPLPLPDLPPGRRVTLGIAGERADLAVEPLAAELRQLVFAAEGRGAVVAGVHLDLLGDLPAGEPGEALEGYAEQLDALRESLDRALFLSVTVPAPWLEVAELEDVTDAVDFIVPFLYGQRPDEAERRELWDLARVESALDLLDELGEPYLLGVVTVGVATHGRETTLLGTATELDLGTVFADRALSVVPGFSLEGGDRRTHLLQADRATTVGPFELERGDRLRLTGLGTADLERLLRTLARRPSELRLGQLYYRLPAPGEGLSLAPGSLVAAHAAEPATPDLALAADLERRRSGSYRVTVTLANQSDEATAYSTLDRNFVELRAPGGEVDHRVTAGGFQRYDLGRRDDAGTFERTLRRPDTVRLFLPLLGGGQTVTSGAVDVRQRGVPVLELRAVFLLPDGRLLEVGPLEWRDGEVVGGPDDEAAREPVPGDAS